MNVSTHYRLLFIISQVFLNIKYPIDTVKHFLHHLLTIWNTQFVAVISQLPLMVKLKCKSTGCMYKTHSFLFKIFCKCHNFIDCFSFHFNRNTDSVLFEEKCVIHETCWIFWHRQVCFTLLELLWINYYKIQSVKLILLSSDCANVHVREFLDVIFFLFLLTSILCSSDTFWLK